MCVSVTSLLFFACSQPPVPRLRLGPTPSHAADTVLYHVVRTAAERRIIKTICLERPFAVLPLLSRKSQVASRKLQVASRKLQSKSNLACQIINTSNCTKTQPRGKSSNKRWDEHALRPKRASYKSQITHTHTHTQDTNFSYFSQFSSTAPSQGEPRVGSSEHCLC